MTLGEGRGAPSGPRRRWIPSGSSCSRSAPWSVSASGACGWRCIPFIRGSTSTPGSLTLSAAERQRLLDRLFHFSRARAPAQLCSKSNFGTERAPPRKRCPASGSLLAGKLLSWSVPLCRSPKSQPLRDMKVRATEAAIMALVSEAKAAGYLLIQRGLTFL